MGSPAEQSTAGQHGDGIADAPDAPSAAQPDRDEELARLEDRWRRAVADLDNVRKRYARELDRERVTERLRVTRAWLPVVDNLELAISHAGDESTAVIEGVRTVLAQAVQVLEHLGFPRDSQIGVPFDAQRHEVVGVAEQPDTAPGTVVEVVRPGYGRDGSRLRPAAVVVSRREE